MADMITVHVTGLREFVAAVKAVDQQAPKAIRKGFNEAAKLVVADARRRAPVRTGRFRASIRVASTSTKAQIREGSSSVPYAGFIDYGNKVHGGRSAVGRKDSQPRRFIPTGRVMYPAFEAVREQVLAVSAAALLDVCKANGLDARNG